MSELQLASRREADDWIAAGWVKVDGQVAVLGQRVQGDVRIEIDPANAIAEAQKGNNTRRALLIPARG